MKKTYVIASLIILLISVWMFSGLIFPSNKTHGIDIEASTSEKAPVKVRVSKVSAQEQVLEVVVMGRTELKRIVDVRADIGGKIVSTPVDKGQRVKAGDILCELAEDDRKAQLARAKAMVDKAQIDHEGVLRLQKDGLISSADIAANKTALEAAKADFKMAQLNVEHLQIRAPFSGFVETRPAEVGALMDRQGVCARLLDESSLLATGQISERDVHLLKLGQPVKVILMSNKVLDGKIRFIGRVADAQTRTYTIEADLNTKDDIIRDGVTAKIIIPMSKVLAHHISPALLALGDDGKVGVRIVNDKSKVEFHIVQVVRETTAGVWVTGLPAHINLITVGQELVADGDVVHAVYADKEVKGAQ